jgi:uncharacterized membrane protein
MSNSKAALPNAPLTLPALGVKPIAIQVLLIAVAAFILPAAAHAAGLPVRAFLPMHWPVLLAGLVYGWRSGLIVGISAPLVSYLFSGMPPVHILPAMMIELSAYGIVAGLAVEKFSLNRFAAAALALVTGRLVFLAYVFSFGAASLPFAEYLQTAMLPGLVAAVGMLIMLPLIAKRWTEDR